MQEIKSFLIEQYVKVQVFDLSIPSNIRNRIVYARNIKIYLERDNLLRLSFVNQDQKNIPILDKTITLYVFQEDSSSVLAIPAQISSTEVGIAYVTFKASDMVQINEGLYSYAIDVVSGEGTDQIAYADDNYGAGGTIEMIKGRYPA